MKKLSKILIVFLISVSLLGCTQGNNDKKVYFIPLIDEGPFWAPLIKGAEAAAEERGYEIVVKSGVSGDPSRPQKLMEAMQEGIDQKVAGISLAALDPTMFDNLAKDAMEQGIKVVTYDTDVASESNRISFVGTDNFEAGIILGEKSATEMKEKGVTGGKLSSITWSGSAENMIERYNGIKKGIENIYGSEAKNFEWLEWIIIGASASDAKMQLEAQMTANEDLQAVYTLGTEPAIAGAMEAIQSQNKQGKVLHYAFDYSPTFDSFVDKNLITGVVDQDSFKIGYESIDKLIDAAEGKKLEDKYPIDVTWITQNEIIQYGKEKLDN